MAPPKSSSFTKRDFVFAVVFPLLIGVAVMAISQDVETLKNGLLSSSRSAILTTVLSAIAVSAMILGFISETKLSRARQEKIDSVEQRFHEQPDKPQLAWDLARVKLENYLDRNLNQVHLIFWLTTVVMFFGFVFVMFGLYQAANDPQKLPVSIVSAASGVIISFVGGSFLIIYKSIMAQSNEYVTVLERINAVGMAVQVIGSIPESKSTLEGESRAELAKQLLRLYGPKGDLST